MVDQSSGSLVDLIDSRVGRLAIPDTFAAFTGSGSQNPNSDTHIFSSVPLGAENPSRQIVVFATSTTAGGPVPITSLSLDVTGEPPLEFQPLSDVVTLGGHAVQWWRYAVPIGTVGDFTLTAGNSFQRSSIFAFSVVNRLEWDVADFKSATINSESTIEEIGLRVPRAGSVVLAGSLFTDDGGVRLNATAGLQTLLAPNLEHTVSGDIQGGGDYHYSGVWQSAAERIIASGGTFVTRHILTGVALR